MARSRRPPATGCGADSAKPAQAKPLSGRPFPAAPAYDVADFVTMWAGYDNEKPRPRR
ncbi:hypothetical protein BO443_130052 [Burkholderia orbicola]